MNEAVINPAEENAKPARRVRFRARLFIYLAVWLLAILAIELLLQPMGPTESHLTPLQQRLQWPLYTPLMVFFGLAQVLSISRDVPQLFFWLFVAVFIGHATLTLSRPHAPTFAALITLQALTIAIGVASFIHFMRLPDGP